MKGYVQMLLKRQRDFLEYNVRVLFSFTNTNSIPA